MKKIYLTTGLLFALVTSSMAQYETYKLDSYVNPNYKRQSLDLNFETAGSAEKTTTSESNGFSGNLGLRYNQIANSEKTQQNTTFTLSGSAETSKNGDARLTSTSTSFSFQKEALYFNEDKKFIEFSPSASLNYSYYMNKSIDEGYLDYTERKSKNNNFTTDIAFKIGIGKGRIENVTDARQAVYILQNLTNKGIISRHLSDNEINAFAQQIALVKNKRRFDYRIGLIDEITVVDSFLVANNYLDKATGAAYFTSLYDMWLYGARDIRESGSYIKGGIRPSYRFYESRNHYDSQYAYYDQTSGGFVSGGSYDRYVNAYSTWQGDVYLDYRNEKPIDLKWQRSIYAGLQAGYGRGTEYDRGFWNAEANFSYTLGYYMNTRTYFEGTFSQNLEWTRWNGDDNDSAQNILNSRTALTGKGYYYLSPQLRLFGQVNVNYRFDRNMNYNYNFNDKYPQTSFSFGLTYAVF